MTDEALKAVERYNELLDEVERMREESERSREIIDSAKAHIAAVLFFKISKVITPMKK